MDETVGGRPMKVVAPDGLGPKTGEYLKLYRKITG
jgi:hypothetical protein